MLITVVQKSDSVMYTHIQCFIFYIMVYQRIINIVPGAIQKGRAVYSS